MSREEKQTLLSKTSKPKESKHVLVIHGGAGTILREKSSPEQQARYHAGLRAALQAGNAILSTAGEAMDAVVAAVSVMEGKWHHSKEKLKSNLDCWIMFRQSTFQLGQGRCFQLGWFCVCHSDPI